ncbi:MAG TPA: peptidase S9, partial [Phaeodactylibacter sp.]|nr:peptidase S9 [Phaeodactylibacter sp.]
MKKLIFLLLIAGFHLAKAQEQPQKGRLTPELLWELGRVSLQDVSPDGRLLLYSVKYYDLAEDKGQSDLYLIHVDGRDKGAAVQLTNTPQSEYNARFRPDGQRIGFLRGGKMYETDLDGQNETQTSETEMTGFLYSPKGNFVLYTAEVKHTPSPRDIYPDLDKTTGLIYDDLMYRHWTEWEDGYYSNLFYAPYRNGQLQESTAVMNEAYDTPLKPFGGMEQIAWSPDERYIAYTCKKLSGVEYARSTNSDIYLFDRQSGYTTKISINMEGYDMNPAFSPDGKILIWNSMKTPGYESDRNRIFAYDMKQKVKWEITKGLDQHANNPQWAPDGASIYFTSPWRGTVQIFQIDFNK